MKLIDAEWKGFASYADKAYVKFSDGLTGIVGTYTEDPRKSMGAGKSTIIMSLLYALFNKGAFKSVGEIVNDSYTEKDHMYVKYKFSKHGHIYTVERGILNGAAYLDFYQDAEPLGENKIASRNEEILKVVGWDYDMFTASIFFEQDKMSKLVDADGSKRREYIEKILNTRDWTLLQELPNKKSKKITEDILLKQKEITLLQDNVDLIKKELVTFNNLDKDIAEKELQKTDFENKIAINSTNIQKTKEHIIVLNHKKDLYTSHCNTLTSLKNSINQYDIALADVDNKLKDIINDTEKDTELLASAKKELATLKFELTECNNVNSNLITNKNILEKDLAVLSHELAQVKKSKQAFTEDIAYCENCEQPISKEYSTNKILEKDSIIQNLEIKHSNLNNNIKDLSEEIITNKTLKIDKLTVDVSQKEKFISQLETKLNNYDSSFKELQTTKEKNSKLQEQYNKELVSSQEIIDAFIREIKDSLSIDITCANDFNIAIKESTDGINLQEKEKEISSYKELVENLTDEIKKLYINKGKLAELSSNLEKYNISITDNNSQLKTLNEDLKIENIVLKGFKEIPSKLFDKNIKKIEEYANEYIKKFIPTMQVCVEEDTSKAYRPIEIFYKFKDKERSYRMLSGGQKTVANLGLRLAFSKIISEKTSSVSEVIFLDEPFAYLDEYSRDLVKNVLSDLQKYYRQIVVISHIDNVTDFPNIINVKMENNRSYII